MKREDLTGKKLGVLTILRYINTTGKGQANWLTRCPCGRESVKAAQDMRRKTPKGCGHQCPLTKESIARNQRTHGMSSHPAYAVWRSMNDRCRLPTHQAWKNYGARGIDVCSRWRESFENFWADMGGTWKKGLDLDRKDNNAGYSLKNCHWTTRKTNTRNRRLSVRLAGFPPDYREQCLAKGIKTSTLGYRINVGWGWKKIISTPPSYRNKYSTSSIAAHVADLRREERARAATSSPTIVYRRQPLT